MFLKIQNQIKLALITMAFCLGGCSSIASYKLSNPPSSTNYRQLGQTVTAVKFDENPHSTVTFQSKNVCLQGSKTCINYLYGERFQKKTSDENFIKMTLKSTTEVVEFSKKYNEFEQFSGTIVLLHGYGANKEAMVPSGVYFRALGFDVIIPDLAGHGQSTQKIDFGVYEHKNIIGLLDRVTEKAYPEKPIILVGHSMGALVAINSQLESDSITAVILMAPMESLDLAAWRAFKSSNPIISRMIGKAAISDGARSSLNKIGSKLSDTMIARKIEISKKPVLIIASSSDNISPRNKWSNIDRQNINVLELINRTHESLALISDSEGNDIIKWLKQILEK
jgi:pimeloyl-ACP methyl ester carboxylesterase